MPEKIGDGLERYSVLEARALLAVGIDGSMVILEVDPKNFYLLHDAKSQSTTLSNVMKFTPEFEPQGPGLYEFKGYSAFEFDQSAVPRVIHRGQCTKVAC